MKKQQVDYDKLQFKEQKETNTILLINTIATVITGIASLILAAISLFNK